jgi:hypothetical protein
VKHLKVAADALDADVEREDRLEHRRQDQEWQQRGDRC